MMMIENDDASSGRIRLRDVVECANGIYEFGNYTSERKFLIYTKLSDLHRISINRIPENDIVTVKLGGTRYMCKLHHVKLILERKTIENESKLLLTINRMVDLYRASDTMILDVNDDLDALFISVNVPIKRFAINYKNKLLFSKRMNIENYDKLRISIITNSPGSTVRIL